VFVGGWSADRCGVSSRGRSSVGFSSAPGALVWRAVGRLRFGLRSDKIYESYLGSFSWAAMVTPEKTVKLCF